MVRGLKVYPVDGVEIEHQKVSHASHSVEHVERMSVTGALHSIFLLLPLGAGSKGVDVYVTVLVTTCLTLTWRGAEHIEGAPKTLVLPSMIQLVGENGERSTLLLGVAFVALLRVALLGAALRGTALLGVALELRGDMLIMELGDCGMRSLRSVVGVRIEGCREGPGRTNGVGGHSGAVAGTLRSLSAWQEQLLPALEGCVIGVR